MAIVIPLYKTKYIDQTLKSLSNQNNKNFNVYIGDDLSKSPPISLINHYSNFINITYTRFSDNVGRVNPVLNWNRCLKLVGDEEWVCFLPDDDEFSENVVDEFYNALTKNADKYISAFKLGIYVRHNDGMLVKSQSSVGEYFTTDQLYYNIIRGLDDCTLGDVIYNKNRLIEIGGFINFPKAWCSDHGTFIQASAGGLIYNISNAFLYFRMSGENISSGISDSDQKMKARYMFGEWLLKNNAYFTSNYFDEIIKYHYWKSEYYFIYFWKFSFKTWWFLYRLSVITRDNYNPIQAIKSLAKAIKTKRRSITSLN